MDRAKVDATTTLIERTRYLLNQNRVEAGSFSYTRPAPSTYEHQWLWDSCFHAIIYRWFDLHMASEELLSVVQHQVREGPDTGMIPHMTYWQGGGEALWGRAERSIITQPPLVGVAAWMVYGHGGDRTLLAELYEPLCAYHDWFDRRRDPDRDHLVSLIHPWESGWDAAPRWDDQLGLTHPSDADSRQARLDLVAVIRQFDCDAAALGEAGYFHVEAVDFNAIRAADLEALARIAAMLGYNAEARSWEGRAESVRQAVRNRLLRPQPCDLAGIDERPLLHLSAAPFVALFGGCADDAQAAALHDTLRHTSFWTPFPIATTPTTDAAFDPDHYWRGNVWLNVNWLIVQGLRRYGFSETARVLTECSIQLASQFDFWEYYNPLSGQGYGSFPHSWSGLILDLALDS